MISYIASLFLMSNVLLLVQSACTEGFMDLSLLERKAADLNSSLTTLAEENKATRWIITDANNRFTCDNVKITEFLIGVDIRTHPPRMMRDKYPSIEVWHQNQMNEYKRSDSVSINLSSNEFNNRIHRFILPTPITVSSGYMLGVHQPSKSKSIVRFYKASASRNTTVGEMRGNKVNKMQSLISGSGIFQSNMTDVIMIHPITSQFLLSLSWLIFNFHFQIQIKAALIKFSLRMK